MTSPSPTKRFNSGTISETKSPSTNMQRIKTAEINEVSYSSKNVNKGE